MILNENQRKVAQLIILGNKDTNVISEKLGLTVQTVNRLKRELEEFFQNLYKYESDLDNKISEVSKIDSDVELIKNVFLKRGDLNG